MNNSALGFKKKPNRTTVQNNSRYMVNGAQTTLNLSCRVQRVRSVERDSLVVGIRHWIKAATTTNRIESIRMSARGVLVRFTFRRDVPTSVSSDRMLQRKTISTERNFNASWRFSILAVQYAARKLSGPVGRPLCNALVFDFAMSATSTLSVLPTGSLDKQATGVHQERDQVGGTSSPAPLHALTISSCFRLASKASAAHLPDAYRC